MDLTKTVHSPELSQVMIEKVYSDCGVCMRVSNSTE